LVVTEEIFEFDEYESYLEFIKKEKPVLNAEYATKFVENESEREKMCSKSNSLNISTLILPRDLDDSFRISCKE